MTDAAQLTAPIPTDHDALVAYLRGLPARDRARLADPLTAQYRREGHPDPLAMAVAAVERAAAEIEDGPGGGDPIPTDPQELYDFLRTLTPAAQCEVADLLAVQLGGPLGATPETIERAADLVHVALRWIANEELIARLRASLAENLATAADAIRAAHNDVDRLSADDVYDVEYAEGGQQVSDLHGFLDDAGRMLRAAAAFNPCPPEKNGADQ